MEHVSLNDNLTDVLGRQVGSIVGLLGGATGKQPKYRQSIPLPLPPILLTPQPFCNIQFQMVGWWDCLWRAEWLREDWDIVWKKGRGGHVWSQRVKLLQRGIQAMGSPEKAREPRWVQCQHQPWQSAQNWVLPALLCSLVAAGTEQAV